MVNVLTEMKEEAKARWQSAEIRRLVERGVLTREAARAEIKDLTETGAISREIGQEALSLLK